MEFEVFRSFDFTGRTNEYGGLLFTIRQRGIHWVFDFFVREIQEGKRPSIRITMEPDTNHGMPHIHLNKQHVEHFASIGLNGDFIHGQERLNRKEKEVILEWVNSHSITLRELWDCAKAGWPDYQKMVDRVNNTWEYDGCVFEGEQPRNHKVLDGINVWYNGNLSTIVKGDLNLIHSTGTMCVIAPTNDAHFLRHWHFSSDVSSPQVFFRTKIDR